MPSRRDRGRTVPSCTHPRARGNGETIDRELGWAAGLGMNSIRLLLHHLLPEVPSFWDRLHEVLAIADGHGIGAMLVLFDLVFDWTQEADPKQPLTAGAFLGVSGALERGDPINRVMLARSDVISFHSYFGRARLTASIDHLMAYRPPILCTEWLGRPRSPVELIDVFAERGVGAYTTPTR
jgi:hypothetical protein